MNFEDRTLVALTQEASRLAVLNDRAARNVVRAAYGVDDGALIGLATAQFDSFSLGGLDEAPADAAGLPAPVLPPAPRIDALWRGGVHVSASWPRARIDSVRQAQLSLARLDEAVAVATGGALPAGPALETARRAELLRRIEAAAGHDEAVTDALLQAWLDKAGIASVAELLQAPGSAPLSQLQLAISPPLGGVAASQMRFPVAVALMVRDHSDPAFRLTEAVAAARRVQLAMRRAGFEPAPSDSAGHGRAVTALLVSQSWFDDVHWPGADPATRISLAGSWMAREGIALVAATD